MRSPLHILTFGAALLLAGCAGDDALPVLHDADGLVIKEVAANDLLEVVRNAGTDLVAVNLWASWCIPCLEEFPEFMEYDENNADVSVRFVSYDHVEDLDAMIRFLERQSFTGETYMKTNEPGPFLTEVDASLSDDIGLPSTAVFNSSGELLTFWQGKVDYAELAGRIHDLR